MQQELIAPGQVIVLRQIVLADIIQQQGQVLVPLAAVVNTLEQMQEVA